MRIELTNTRVVAVDGSTATGKGRLMEELSQLLRTRGIPVIHISTGSLYRAVAEVALEEARLRVKGRHRKSESEVTAEALQLIRDMSAERLLELAGGAHIEMHGGVVWIAGAAATEEQLKGLGVGTGSSIVSIPYPVRDFVDDTARRQINEFDGFVLIDGRDMTNDVVPEAPLRILLTVSPHVAVRRSKEHTLEEIMARDTADRAKQRGRLRHPDDPGEGVLVLPTDEHTPESVRDHVYGLMREVWPQLPA
jgi:cytidylate kinase